MSEHKVMDRKEGSWSVEILEQLIGLLEAERKALLQGDAATVAGLALNKDQLAQSLSELCKNNDSKDAGTKEIADLTSKIAELAGSNHKLLMQMYQHYQGMLDVFLKIAGQGSTYGRSGLLDVGHEPTSNSRVTA